MLCRLQTSLHIQYTSVYYSSFSGKESMSESELMILQALLHLQNTHTLHNGKLFNSHIQGSLSEGIASFWCKRNHMYLEFKLYSFFVPEKVYFIASLLRVGRYCSCCNQLYWQSSKQHSEINSDVKASQHESPHQLNTPTPVAGHWTVSQSQRFVLYADKTLETRM